MTGKITKEFRLYTAEQFYESLSESPDDTMYFFIAKSTSWPDDDSPPAPTDTVGGTVYDIWDNMLGMKRITAADVSYCVPRTPWVSGTVYSAYTDYTEFYTNNDFYVLTDDYNIYMCLDNNGGGASTVKPTGFLTTNYITGDGYKWKYLMTISAADALKFVTLNYMPVKKLAADDGSNQWDVQQAAKNGAIEQVRVISGGTGYLYNSGTATTANSSTITLAISANVVADVYNGAGVYISAGTGEGQFKQIVNYSGPGRIVTVNNAFSPVPDNTSTYVVAPRVVAVGNGTGFSGYASANAGIITKVNILSYGNSYTYATMTPTQNTSWGTGGSLDAQISPYGGHGADVVRSLFAHNVMLNVKLTGSESNTFVVSNDYRIMGLIERPLQANDTVAAASVYDQTTILSFSVTAGSFETDETITGAITGATGSMVVYRDTNKISVTGNQKSFQVSELISGSVSGKTATITAIDLPDLKKYSGRVMYIENRLPISRASDSAEDTKIIVKF